MPLNDEISYHFERPAKKYAQHRRSHRPRGSKAAEKIRVPQAPSAPEHERFEQSRPQQANVTRRGYCYIEVPAMQADWPKAESHQAESHDEAKRHLLLLDDDGRQGTVSSGSPTPVTLICCKPSSGAGRCQPACLPGIMKAMHRLLQDAFTVVTEFIYQLVYVRAEFEYQ